MIVSELFLRIKVETAKKITIATVTVISLLVFAKINFTGLNEYLKFYPEDVAEIDSVAQKYHLERGIAEYWMAKKAYMLSRTRTKVAPVYEDGSLSDYGASLECFRVKKFDFIVANNLAAVHIKKRFKILDTIKTPNCIILRVSPFTYPKRSFLPMSY
jgi:hypothetical protein